ncbi:MAG TPA: hypothetical protein VFD23_06095 [Clostridia bacterium]|nr:hypothetical protein [Clostridia bacterium]
MMKNNNKKKALISCIAEGRKACKKGLALVMAVVMAVTLVAVSVLPLTAQAVQPNMVEVLIKVNREVVKLPDLYERLTLNLRTTDNAEGLAAVEVLNIRMDQLGDDPISIGSYSGPDLYVFFTITFDGPESGNEYQGSKVLTSYEFFTKSDKKLNVFKILEIEGNAFEDMTNLNPGDPKTGRIYIDPLSFALSTETEESIDNLPQTDDPTPVKLLIYLSAGLGAFLCVQVIVYVKRKRKDKMDELGI